MTAGRARHVLVRPGAPGLIGAGGRTIPVDVVFPVLHGPFGEDGTVQGLLEMAGLPYVGSGVYASAAVDGQGAHEGGASRRRAARRADYAVVQRGRRVPEAAERLGLPVFVKPARGGSSIGISKVIAWEQLLGARLPWPAKSIRRSSSRPAVAAARSSAVCWPGGDGAPEAPEASVPAEITVATTSSSTTSRRSTSPTHGLHVPAELPPDVTPVQRLAVRPTRRSTARVWPGSTSSSPPTAGHR